LALQEHGWRRIMDAKDCNNAFFKFFRTNKNTLDGVVYDHFCTQHSSAGNNNTWKPSFTFGLEHDTVFGSKEQFNTLVSSYEVATKGTSSAIPLSFNLNHESECKEFFSLKTNAKSLSWVSKDNWGQGGLGVATVSDFDAFEMQYGACKDPRAPIVQQFVKPPLLNGKTWNYRVYLMIASVQPLRAFRRLGDFKICVEDYEKRNDVDPDVRAGATKCNVHVGMQSPRWHSGEPDELKFDDIQKPLEEIATILDDETTQLLWDKTDESMRSLVGAMADQITVPENTDGPDHRIGFYAIDAMLDEASGEVKLLELNTFPNHRSWTAPMDDIARMALTSFYEFGLDKEQYSIDSCVEQFPAWSKLV